MTNFEKRAKEVMAKIAFEQGKRPTSVQVWQIAKPIIEEALRQVEIETHDKDADDLIIKHAERSRIGRPCSTEDCTCKDNSKFIREKTKALREGK